MQQHSSPIERRQAPAAGTKRCASSPQVRFSIKRTAGNRTAGLATAAILASLALAPLAAAQAPASAPLVSPRPGSTVKAQFDDWKHECSKPPGAKVELCAITQDVSDESNSEIGVSVHVQKVAGGESVLRIIAPLGVLLTQNLAVKVDGDYLGEAPFLRCYVLGCQAQIEMDNNLRSKMFAGTTLLLIVHRTREQGVGIPVSLKGFSQAFAALK